MAASGDLLDVDPPELQFPFELDKQISCPLKMTNKTESNVAFKVKTTSPKKYCVRPNNGVVRPRSTCVVVVTMQAQTIAPPDLQCKDKFLVQSVVVGDGLSAQDITPQMFMKKEGNVVEEVKMRVTYVMPPESPSEIAEENDGPQRILVPVQQILDNGRSASELSSGSVSLRSAELGTEVGSPRGPLMRTEELLKAAGHAVETRTYAGPDVQSLELSALIAKLTEEKDSALEQNKKLRNELALRYVPISSDGNYEILVPTLYVNRASTMHKLGLLKQCLRDCNRAISVSSNYAKAWYRRGMVNASLKKYSSAIHDLKVALSMEVTSSGKSNIEQELKLILLKHRNVNEVGRSSSDCQDAGLPHTAEPHKVVLECASTPNKGRGMMSLNVISPASLIHVEDPLAAIIIKSCRETHCHYCFSEAPADVVFCPLCTIPVYCSKECQEQAVGDISWNQDTSLEFNSHHLVDNAKLGLTSTRCKTSNSKQIAEHMHECGGAHWAAVLPADIVLAGRVMAQYIDKRLLTGKSSAISGPNLDLVHHYDIDSPTSKLESHIYAIVLLLCLQKYYRSDLSWREESLSQLVLLICQIKVNSIAIVHMKSVDGGQELTESKGYSTASDAVMCSVEQIRVAQAIYMSGSLFNHSCRPNVHTYFHSRTLFLRSTEYIESGSPLELSYGPQAGEMDLLERQKSLQENYKFSCRCSSCSELNLSDLVIDSFCCPRSFCLGAVSESTCYRSEENFVHVSLNGSAVCKLSLPDVSKVDEDMEKVGKLFFRNDDADLKIDPGYCMSCRSQLDLSSVVATLDRAASKINRFKELIVIDDVSEVLITNALQSLEQIKKLRHPYSKALARAEDKIAEAFAKVGDQEQARKHCEASIKILEKLYHPKHIAIAHELIKLISIKLCMGDKAGAAATVIRAEAIFSLYYGPDVQRVLPYIDALKIAVSG